jgi:hypothetical protein
MFMRSSFSGIVPGLLGLALFLSSQLPATAQHTLRSNVFGSGSSTAVVSGFAISSTVGQPVIGEVSNASFIHQVGFWYLFRIRMTGVEGLPGTILPIGFRLDQSHPNPFNPVTNIGFAVPVAGHVKLTVFNVSGRTVATIVDKHMTPGEYAIMFNARHLASGAYWYRLQADGFVKTRKLILLK